VIQREQGIRPKTDPRREASQAPFFVNKDNSHRENCHNGLHPEERRQSALTDNDVHPGIQLPGRTAGHVKAGGQGVKTRHDEDGNRDRPAARIIAVDIRSPVGLPAPPALSSPVRTFEDGPKRSWSPAVGARTPLSESLPGHRIEMAIFIHSVKYYRRNSRAGLRSDCAFRIADTCLQRIRVLNALFFRGFSGAEPL